MADLSKNKEEINLPKTEEFNKLILTEDKIKVGSLFFEDSTDYIIIISEIKEGRVRTSQYDPYNKIITGNWGSESIESFIKRYQYKYIPDFDAYSQQAEDYLFKGKEFEIKNTFQDTNQTSLVHSTNKQMLISLHNEIDIKKREVEIVKQMVSLKIKEQQNKLNIVRRKMEEQISIFNKELTRIMKVIGMIELYLGIKEELFQLQSGNPASINTPISLRQLILYADEELGNCDDGGIDYTKLDLFDNWMLNNDNYKMLIPEERGIVAMKPRRRDKQYNDPVQNAMKNFWNKQTYFLIRNGENLYRICSENISVGVTLFPLKNEFNKLFDELENSRYNSDKDRIIETQEELRNRYMKISLFIQGLIDRTSVFEPIQPGIKISDIESSGGFNLIYDAEYTLPDGKLPFKDFKQQINSTVSTGSRIVLIPDYEYNSNNWCNNGEGFLRYYNNSYSCPQFPSKGLYTLIKVESEGKKYDAIRYMPSNEVYSWTNGYTDRKNKVTWVVSLKNSNYLNYDLITLEDIDYYLNSRIERPNYLYILPVLRELKKHLIKELEREVDFKKMLKGELLKNFSSIKEEVLDQKIDASIIWWKTKNIWKRPITIDDSKAYRMILSKIKREI